MHDRSLDWMNRGHHYDAFLDAIERSRGRGFEICAHVILGLPGESHDDMLATAREVARLGLDAVKIHNLYAVKNTPLADQVAAGASAADGARRIRRDGRRLSGTAAAAVRRRARRAATPRPIIWSARPGVWTSRRCDRPSTPNSPAATPGKDRATGSRAIDAKCSRAACVDLSFSNGYRIGPDGRWSGADWRGRRPHAARREESPGSAGHCGG